MGYVFFGRVEQTDFLWRDLRISPCEDGFLLCNVNLLCWERVRNMKALRLQAAPPGRSG